MRLSFRRIAFAVVGFGAASSVSCNAAPPTTAKVAHRMLEFRRAEEEPAAGLTPATVPGWDVQMFLHPTADITDSDVAEARLVTESQEPNPVVELIFTSDGAKKMATLAKEHVGKRFAILLDGKVVSAPQILLPEFSGGQIQISGKLTKDEVERLVKSINAK